MVTTTSISVQPIICKMLFEEEKAIEALQIMYIFCYTCLNRYVIRMWERMKIYVKELHHKTTHEPNYVVTESHYSITFVCILVRKLVVAFFLVPMGKIYEYIIQIMRTFKLCIGQHMTKLNKFAMYFKHAIHIKKYVYQYFWMHSLPKFHIISLHQGCVQI